jgi:tetratricopeptide (TPR) repeat protein/ADP-heptose:LPS heptosyltransferase
MSDADRHRSAASDANSNPPNTAYWVSMGNALCGQQRWQEAVEAFGRALAMSPGDAAILSNISVALLRSGRAEEAIQCAKQAFALDHSNAAICANLGACLLAQERWADAEQAFRAATANDPTNSDLWCNLGRLLQHEEKLDEAIDCFRRAVEVNPKHAEAHRMLGNALKNADQIDEALECFRSALELNPRSAAVHNSLGATLERQGKFDEAGACYRRAVEAQPDSFESHLNLAAAMLLTGNFEEGWLEYDTWWKKHRSKDYGRPRWEGENLAGKTIVLHPELGLGDTIQFVRYAPLLKERGATVIVECQKPLAKILARSPGVDRLLVSGDELLDFDFFSPLIRLARILTKSPDAIPAGVPYVFADEKLVHEWSEKLQRLDGFRIGINWRGSGDFHKLRDIPLHRFERLASVPGVRLVSLQKDTGDGGQETAGAVGTAHPTIVDLGEIDTQHGAFMDTAAIMMNLDLVITSDTSIAHLAGALGVPVWVALPYVPDWRWMLDRSDSPWYPTMRLFRQKQSGDWAGVFGEVEAELRRQVRKV